MAKDKKTPSLKDLPVEEVSNAPVPKKVFGKKDVVALTWRVSPEMHLQLKRAADAEGVSVQHLLDLAWHEYKQNHGIPDDS